MLHCGRRIDRAYSGLEDGASVSHSGHQASVLMKIAIAALISSAMLASCSGLKSQQGTNSSAMDGKSFFQGIDATKLSEPDRSMVLSAQKDIDLVLQGQPPACKASSVSGESDGGTLHYKCDRYGITVMRSIYRIGDVQGFLYGPIITFPDDYPISYVRFFSDKDFDALLEQGNGRK
jgi:hypothetical protein